MRAPRRDSPHYGSDRRDSLFGDITQRRHSLFGNMIHLSSSARRNSRSSQQKYMSERKTQLNPWTSFLRRENHEDDPVHICVCVCVRACVYSGLELGMRDTVWWRSSVLTSHKQKFLPFAGDKETQMVKCHADSKVEDSKLARLFFTFVSHVKYSICEILKKNVAEPVLVRVCAPLRACVYICVAVLYINTHATQKMALQSKRNTLLFFF